MVLGSWNRKSTICPFRARKWPFQAPKTLRFKGKMANFEATNTAKQGKQRQKGKWYPFHAWAGGGEGMSPPKFRGCGLTGCACETTQSELKEPELRLDGLQNL